MTREDWLMKTARILERLFEEAGYGEAPKYRASIGFPSTGSRGKRIGECWADTCSKGKTHEIFIHPGESDSLEVAAILAHEMVHAYVGLAAGHGPAFRKCATGIGLEGKMTATRPGEKFQVFFLDHIKPKMGTIPHETLSSSAESSTKKQTTRLLKASCECGYTVRITRTWVDEVGAPHCPLHGEMDVFLG